MAYIFAELYFHFQHNRIFVVPQDTFLGVKTMKMYMDLSFNNIYDLSDGAFNGVESAITILKLNNNMLKTLPSALAHLTSLVYLEIQSNPIKTFDVNVMSPIGKHLHIFFVGSDVVTNWPMEFSELSQLNTLRLYDMQMDFIPNDAFSSFNTTLRNLLIKNTNLSEIPAAICDLQNMDNFDFINNTHIIGNDTIMPNCSAPLTNVLTAKFDGNDFNVFPNVFEVFPNLTTLYVVGNPNLTNANDTMIPQGSKLRNLYMYKNGFEWIPSEINALHNLLTLDLHGNKITELHESDVSGLKHLTRFYLDSNPLYHIDFDAIRNMIALNYLNLDRTNITSIPDAIVGSPSLQSISLQNDQINCTCDALLWMTDWPNIHSVRISGTCAYPSYGEDIEDYITRQLPKC